MEPKISIFIADDHPVFLAGLISIIGRRDDAEICGQATNGDDALAEIRRIKPDIALLDLQMPGLDGLQIAEQYLKENPDQKIILLTMFNDENIVRRALGFGVRGFVLKENAVSQVTLAIDAVATGGIYLSPQLTGVLTHRKDLKPSGKDELFTSAEKKILKLIGEGKSSKEISSVLFVTEKTIENHRGNICRKLGISGTSALLRYAMQNKSKFE
ncbi:MAG: response regulator transcription factor [Ignavibacteriaceae bacterium]|nr:response regulator transcription factor [Ignavibacteriaceae bacterium]